MSKEKAQAIAVKHSELVEIQGHGERAVLGLEQATRAILEYSDADVKEYEGMIPKHILSVDGEAIGLINWRLSNNGFSDCPRYPMVGEVIVASGDRFLVESVFHCIDDQAIVYHLKRVGA